LRDRLEAKGRQKKQSQEVPMRLYFGSEERKVREDTLEDILLRRVIYWCG
jgi:hypothetical protein